ncbi:MAG: hypothetical protein GX913_03450 [Clostridiales bacterium]|nr:hypothetical protein [Clostridiales bacterium]
MKKSCNYFISNILFAKDLSRNLRRFYPADERLVRKKTVEILLKSSIGIGLAVLLLFIFMDFRLYYLVLVGVLGNSIYKVVVLKNIARIELKLLSQLENFMSELRFSYQGNSSLEDAYLDAMGNAEYEMNLQGELLFQYCLGKEINEKNEYADLAPNSFFLMLYILCQSNYIYGDQISNEGSHFLINLTSLKEQITEEILRRKKSNALFSGLEEVSLAALFAIRPIEYWAVSNLEDLTVYYNSRTGRISTIIIYTLTFLVFYLIQFFHYEDSYKKEGNSCICKISNIDTISYYLIQIINHQRNYVKLIYKNLLMTDSPYSCKEFLCKQIIYVVAGTFIGFILFGINIAGLILGILCGVAPLVKLLFLKEWMKQKYEEEVVRFQTVILILKNIDGMSVETIFEWMCKTAFIFREGMESILGRVGFMGNRLINELEEEMNYPPFSKLLKGFLACDRLPICQVFEYLEVDKRYYLQKQKQEKELWLSDTVSLGKVIAYIPMFLVVIFKLILPFVIEGLSQLSFYSEGISSII